MLVLLGGLAAAAELHVGYHGHLVVHPGAAARWVAPREAPLALVPEVEAGGWVHPRHQLALYARGGAALAHRGGRGGVHDLFVHLGLQRSTWLVPTYVVEDGEIRRPALAGQGWLTGTVGVGLGHGAWSVRPQLTLRGPQFHGVGYDLAVQVSARLGGGR